jgi:menaquinone-dependent protoporphyrinogen IX oxidase
MKVWLLFLFLCCFCVPAFSSKTQPLIKRVRPVQSLKILVVFYSRTGTTRNIAREIAIKLGSDIEEIIDKKDRSGLFKFLESSEDTRSGKIAEIAEMKKNPKDYDLVIIGTPVWDETLSTPVRAYLLKHKDKLPENIAFFATSRVTEAKIVVKKAEMIIGKSFVSFTGFSSFSGDLSKERKEVIIQEFINTLKK